MLYWALVFFILAIVAGFLGFGAIGGTLAFVAKILLVVFLIAFIFSLFTGYRRRPLA